ncbi:MAG: hypothetical protein AAF652_08580 [Cyanobacteria bacterium P01_C01_bin.72]
MSSAIYKSIVLLYGNDDGSTSLRHVEYEINPDTGLTYVPLTPLVLARSVAIASELEGTNINLRCLNLVISGREFKAVIPYNPANLTTLKACIREILNSPGVIAGRYLGESENNGDTANNNL